MTKQKAPLHVLRGILRLSKTPPLPKEIKSKESKPPSLATTSPTTSTTSSSASPSGHGYNKNALQQFVLDKYRQHQHESSYDERTQTLLRQTASNYLEMKRDLVERGRLYKIDTGAEVQLGGSEMSRRAAARAGLQLPKTFTPDA